MQLQPGEKSILAYFTADRYAREAVQSLKSQGYTDVRMDSISKTIQKSRSTGVSSLSELNGGSSYDRFKGHGPLFAADPSVSGLSSFENTPEIYSYLVTVVTDDQGLDYAREALLACGASLNG